MPFLAADAYVAHWSVFRIVDRKGAGRHGGIYLEKLGTDTLPSAGDSYATVGRGRSAAAPTLFFLLICHITAFLDARHYVITHLQEFKAYDCPAAPCKWLVRPLKVRSACSRAELEVRV